jgi:FkbM family methyltransferase
MNHGVRVLGRAAGLVPRGLALHLYRWPPVATTVRAVLNAVLPAGLHEVNVVGGPLARARLTLDLKREKYLWLGTYESPVQEAILRHLKPGTFAWDVGAFIGYHTLLMRRIAGLCRVIALEPDPINRSRLERHLAANDAEDVVVLPVAAGKARGRAHLDHRVGHPSETRVVPAEIGACKVVTLDGLLEGFPPPALVKLDVEGGEESILAGAVRLIEETRPVWVLETHGAPGVAAAQRLQEAGYAVQRIDRRSGSQADLPVDSSSHVVAVP